MNTWFYRELQVDGFLQWVSSHYQFYWGHRLVYQLSVAKITNQFHKVFRSKSGHFCCFLFFGWHQRLPNMGTYIKTWSCSFYFYYGTVGFHMIRIRTYLTCWRRIVSKKLIWLENIIMYVIIFYINIMCLAQLLICQ